MLINLKLVTMNIPCSSCLIIQKLMEEVISKVIAERNFSYELCELGSPEEIYNIDGLEVEKLPSIFINDEQITAGNILTPNELIDIIDEVLDNAV